MLWLTNKNSIWPVRDEFVNNLSLHISFSLLKTYYSKERFIQYKYYYICYKCLTLNTNMTILVKFLLREISSLPTKIFLAKVNNQNL
jgi:hypothetical protein